MLDGGDADVAAMELFNYIEDVDARKEKQRVWFNTIYQDNPYPNPEAYKETNSQLDKIPIVFSR